MVIFFLSKIDEIYYKVCGGGGGGGSRQMILKGKIHVCNKMFERFIWSILFNC